MSTYSAVKSRNISIAEKPEKPKKNRLVVFYRKFSKRLKKNKSAAVCSSKTSRYSSRISRREANVSSRNSLVSKKKNRHSPGVESSRKTDSMRRNNKANSSHTVKNRGREERDKKGKTRKSNEKSKGSKSKSKPSDTNSDSGTIRKPPKIPQKTVVVVPQKQLEKLKERLAKPTSPRRSPAEEGNGSIGTICFPKPSPVLKPGLPRSPKPRGGRSPRPRAQKQPELKEEFLQTGEELVENYDASTKVEENKNFNGPIIIQDAQFKRMVPFWQLPATEEEKDEMFEELRDKVIDKELCQQMIIGAIKPVNAPEAKPKLDAEGDGELEAMEKIDQEYFDFDVVVGNTLKTVLFGFEEPEQGAKANGAKQHKPIPITFNEPKTAKFYDPSKKLTTMEPKEEKWTRTGIKLDPKRQNA